jgi:hypothetical protein
MATKRETETGCPARTRNAGRPRGLPLSSKARASLICGVLGFVALQVGLDIAIESWLPELRDPEFGTKRARLNERQKQDPDRPFLLLLGSSRTEVGIRPEVLSADLPSGPEAPSVFNFGITMGGPMTELLCLKRLLRDGIRPQGVIIEVLPIWFRHSGISCEEVWWQRTNRLGWRDLGFLKRYSMFRRQLYRDFAQTQLVPWHSHRFRILSRAGSRQRATPIAGGPWTPPAGFPGIQRPRIVPSSAATSSATTPPFNHKSPRKNS